MKKFALILAVATFGVSLAAHAQDPESGLTTLKKNWYGDRYGDNSFDVPLIGAAGLRPLYYRPTMRYYGNGYTVSYRYMPVYRQDSIYIGGTSGSSNFRTEAFHIPTDEIPSWGVNSPRLTVKDARSGTPRTAVTTIVRKKTTSKSATKAAPNDPPAVIPSTAPASPEAAPVPPKP